MYVRRLATEPLCALSDSPVGRGLILTGARQTGKTTLLQREFVPPFEYHSFDEPLVREALSRRPAADWIARGQSYVFDEVQKAPPFLGTTKVILDRGGRGQRLILSGSAQIQLLAGVRETLAGRVVTRELFPLTALELAGATRPWLGQLVGCRDGGQLRRLMDDLALSPLAAQQQAATARGLEHLLEWGGLPALLHLDAAEHRWIWLEEYCRTYLQRDVSDLGRVGDLNDFVRLEKVAARRTAGLVNYADVARDADLSPVTAKKYLRYLELSYQAFLLPAFRAPSRKRLQKSPRLHWLDLGVQRVLSGLRVGLTGPQLETADVAALYKLVHTLRLEAELSHLRTKDGREVDLLLRTPHGYLAFEVKAAHRASRADGRHLRGLQALLDGPLIGGFVVYLGRATQQLDEGLYALPAVALLGGTGAPSV